MDYQQLITFIMEMIGTIAFAASGAMVAVDRAMDIFGVIVLGDDNGSRRRCSSRCDIRNCSTGNVSETNLYHCSHIYLLYRVSDTLFKKRVSAGT